MLAHGGFFQHLQHVDSSDILPLIEFSEVYHMTESVNHRLL